MNDGNPFTDWRHRIGGRVYQRPNGEWRLANHEPPEFGRKLRRYRPSDLVRWLVFLWWGRVYFGKRWRA